MPDNNEVTELHKSMVAALRNPENVDNLIISPVRVGDLLTSAICWVDTDEAGNKTVNPLTVLVTPEIFKLLKPC